MDARGMPRGARVVHGGTVALGVLAALFWGVQATRSPWAAPELVVAVGTAAACALFQVRSFSTVWRGRRLALHPDEAVLLLALLLAPAASVVLGALAGTLAGQLALRKPAVKAAFNVGAQLVAASAGALAFLAAVKLGASDVAAALLVPVVVSAVNQSLVAALLTKLSGRPVREAWNGHLMLTIAVAAVAGVVLGVVALALYRFHIAALALLLPVWILTHRSVAFAVYTENELATRRALNELSARLLAESDEERIVALALQACDDAFAPDARGLSLGPEGNGHADAARPRSVRHSAPIRHGGTPRGVLWIELPDRGRRERERITSLLGLVANHVALALARAEAEREAELRRQALARAERLTALGNLVAGIEHEVNNPLMYMASNLDILEMDLADARGALERRSVGPDEADLSNAKEQIGRVRGGADRILKISRALGVIARGARPSETQPLPLMDIVRQVVDLVTPTLPPGVALRVEGDEAALVHGVDADLHHAVLAVVQNAIDASAAEGGVIDVACRRVEEAVSLVVEDHGEGMSEEVARQAFDPFFTTKPDGVGLGLAAVLSIVTAHEGTVRVRTTAGEGTTVELRLPGLPHAAAVGPLRGTPPGAVESRT